LSQFVIIFFIMTPIEAWGGVVKVAGFLIPMAPGAAMLRAQMARGELFDLAYFGIALANGMLYFVLGLGTFHIANKIAKSRGLLSGY
jgi:ABC-2 type transport system permease protein